MPIRRNTPRLGTPRLASEDREAPLPHGFYFATGVQKETLIAGSTSIVGYLDDNRVLKYPYCKGRMKPIEDEAAVYRFLGEHRYIIKFLGCRDSGIILARAPNGSLFHYLRDYHDGISMSLRVKWSWQICKAVKYFHSKRFIHCDINTSNILLDADLNVKFCDLQGCLLTSTGRKSVNSHTIKDNWERMPDADPEESSVRTDLFALGTTLYEVERGAVPFPQYDLHTDANDEQFRKAGYKIARRFTLGWLPDGIDKMKLGWIIRSLWEDGYVRAAHVLDDLACVAATIPQAPRRSTRVRAERQKTHIDRLNSPGIVWMER